jgi:hypothetical protein
MQWRRDTAEAAAREDLRLDISKEDTLIFKHYFELRGA